MKYQFSVFIIISTILSGCAFQSEDSKERADQASFDQAAIAEMHGQQLGVDWSNEPSPRLGETLKAVRQLIKVSENTFEASSAVTLPTQVPASIHFALEVPERIMNQQVLFSRGSFISGSQRFQIVSTATLSELVTNQQRRVVLLVSGLNALFHNEESISGTLEIEVFGDSIRLFILRVPVRTPPSHLNTSLQTFRDWMQGADAVKKTLVHPMIGNKQINLIQVVQITNHEDKPIEALIPKRTNGSLYQWANSIEWSEQRCGYTYIEHVHNEIISSDILMIPIMERMIPLALELVDNPELRDVLSLKLNPGESFDLGIYAIGDEANRWMSQGPRPSEVSTRNVVYHCTRYCASYGGDTRFCDTWDDRFDRRDIDVGTFRRGITLNIPEIQTGLVARFADLDFAKDSESRTIGFISQQSEVLWSN